MPFETNANDNFTITKRDGTNFTTEEVEGLKFTINGNAISAQISSSVTWVVGQTTVLSVERVEWASSIQVHMYQNGYTISAVE